MAGTTPDGMGYRRAMSGTERAGGNTSRRAARREFKVR
jgi:hypothetical protein